MMTMASRTRTAVAVGFGMLAAAAAAFVALPTGQPGGKPLPAAPGPVQPMQIGMNLGMMRYWSQEFVFSDLVAASEIKVVTAGGWLPAAGLVSLDSTGRPRNVPAGTRLMVMLKSGGGDRLPSGVYDCTISPDWEVKGSPGGRITGSGQRFALNVGPANSPARLSLELTPKAKTANLDTLSCRDRGTPADQPFGKAFLADTHPFAVLRFMDWMKANNQPPQDWSTRTTPQSFSQAGPNGVAVEHMVTLANTQNADPWFNMPMEAPDSYYRAFATYVRDHLRPDRRAYVEVSNEVWNGVFEQSKRATARGLELYPGETPIVANSLYYADRVRAVMAIWSEVFRGNEKRIVRVLATQAGSVNRPTAALSHQDTARFVDALAIAPYFGPSRGEPSADSDVKEYLLSHGSDFVDKAVRHGVASKAVAARFGLPLITYEGGPDYVSFRPRMAAAFAAAEHDPRMYDIYTQFLKRWQSEVGGLYVAYDFVNTRFGHQLYTGQPLSEAPKMRALIDFIRTERLNNGRAG